MEGEAAGLELQVARLTRELEAARAELDATRQSQAASAEAVLDTLGRMSSRLRGTVGESLRSVEAFDVPVARATTPSLEALRAYTVALEERRRGAEVEAIPFLERALSLDPGFAAAATTLSTVYGNLGEASKSVEYARLAYAQRDEVSHAITALTAPVPGVDTPGAPPGSRGRGRAAT